MKFNRGVHINGKIYFTPCSGILIGVLDINEKKVYTITIKNGSRFYEFYGSVIVDK